MSQLFVDNIKSRTGGAIGAPSGIVVTGVGTFSGDLSVGGVLTYEDVTSIDSVGIITARSDVSIADKIVHTGDTNTAIRFPAADTFTVETAGSEAIRIDSSGRLLVGTDTATTVQGVTAALQLQTSTYTDILTKSFASYTGIRLSRANNTPASPTIVADGNNLGGLFFHGYDGTDYDCFAGFVQCEVDGTPGSNDMPGRLIFATASDGAATATERLRIDSSGRLLVGTDTSRAVAGVQWNQQVEGTGNVGVSVVSNSTSASTSYLILGKSRGASIGSNTIVNNGDPLGIIFFNGADGDDLGTAGASVKAEVDGTPGSNDMPGRLVFSTTASGASSPTERMRITEAGRILLGASSPSGANEQVSALSTETRSTFVARNTNASLQQDVLIVRANRTTTDGTFRAYSYYNDGAGAYRFYVLDSGNVLNTNNSYGAISDLKLKENIVDANSQWFDIKSLQVRNYNFKEGQTHTQIGLVAQEAELVSPGLVSESPDRDADGNDLGTVTKSVNYSVLYMKAVKALQEAMERIETLETQNADLLARVTALEG